MNSSEKLKEIESLGALVSSTKIMWMIKRIKKLEAALEFYAQEDYVLSGSDYQMYATSSSRQAFDDGGETARKALEEE